MAIAMNPQLACSNHQILCGCANTSKHLQIIRIANIPDWYFERVVFPGQRLLFEAPREAELEVYTRNIPKSEGEKLSSNRLAYQVLSLVELKKHGVLLTPSLTLFLVNGTSV